MANSMDLVTSKKYILRVKTHCGKCESKLKKYILGIAGISSAKMDEKQGTMTISGSLDPFFNYMMLIEKGFGLKTELLWEQKKPSPSTNNGGSNSSQDEVNAAKSRKVDDHHDPRVIVVIAQPENLSGTKVLESVEIKLSFKSQNGDVIGNKNVELMINQKEVDNNSDHHQKAKTSVNTASAAAGGGLCGASTSCCGNHHHHRRVVDVDQNPNKGFV
ncbi:OLC1v1027644C1 [Oldenlandia corymbosa var. corymbosa]|uniref:OLC1v1027644C1 n=1 Tax=Oldenlandia corymbosa var. corymbosa TaxID=529605 RepID=A0AAV1CBX7_OLDCO|nr:OLC1v1027644C1 [Oldenlandia corymbosa var. corymbosa]